MICYAPTNSLCPTKRENRYIHRAIAYAFNAQRDWPDLNRRPSASDLCEFPHSPDYTFTLGNKPLGGGRLVSRPS
jgi:hypothetical protein